MKINFLHSSKTIFLRKIKYCLPIIKSSKEEVLQEILQNLNHYDFFEVWVDYIKDIDEDFIRRLINQLGGRLLVVFRRKNLDKMKLSFRKRLEIISSLENSDSLIDLDIAAQKKELDCIQKQNIKICCIASYHNYQQTPSNRKLRGVIQGMAKYQPKIYKVSTFCQTNEDVIRLLQLLLQLKQKRLKYIILGMGEFGILTRLFGTLWGNEMIFAPIEKSGQSAPGQLTKKQLETIFNILKD